jgi:hypothetical protein
MSDPICADHYAEVTELRSRDPQAIAARGRTARRRPTVLPATAG